MNRLGLSWVIGVGMVGAALKPLVKPEQQKAPMVSAPATSAASPAEIASGIDYNRDNAEAENSPYRRLVKAATAECVERYGKKVADNLKGVQAICAEYYEPSTEDEETEMSTSQREAMDDFYLATLAQLSRTGKIPAALNEKEQARMSAKWSR